MCNDNYGLNMHPPSKALMHLPSDRDSLHLRNPLLPADRHGLHG
jgi:hypothetical protein